MQASGGKLSFAKIDLPGRTPKALTHLWAKLSKDYDGPGGDGDGDEADGAVTPSTPASKRGKASKYTCPYITHSVTTILLLLGSMS